MTEITPGSVSYGKFLLAIYDIWVLWISNSYAWLCSTKKVMLPLFQNNYSSHHLDIGVGTGYFPAKALENLPVKQQDDRRLTLIDLNPNSLHAARARVLAVNRDADVQTYIGNALGPIPSSLENEKFDSASLFYLLHCMSGTSEEKTKVFVLARQHLSTHGILTGATILMQKWTRLGDAFQLRRDSCEPNWLASRLLSVYNTQGIFGNARDDPNVFDQALRRNFEQVECWTEGHTFLFRAANPRAIA